MRLVTLDLGSRGCDTVEKLGPAQCAALVRGGFTFVVRYLVSLTSVEMADITASGLALSFVTYANSFDPQGELAALARLGVPKGAVVWLDVESVQDEPAALIQRINTWAHALKAAGYIPGMYVGVNCKLTSAELYALAVERYWHSCSRVLDRNGAEAAPACGWCCYQCTCEVEREGVEVDIDFAYADYRGRTVTMVSA